MCRDKDARAEEAAAGAEAEADGRSAAGEGKRESRTPCLFLIALISRAGVP